MKSYFNILLAITFGYAVKLKTYIYCIIKINWSHKAAWRNKLCLFLCKCYLKTQTGYVAAHALNLGSLEIEWQFKANCQNIWHLMFKKWGHMTHHVYLSGIQCSPGRSFSFTDLHHRDATHRQMSNTRPLSRMQLWIFNPQRDNEVDSRAKNEPVVLWVMGPILTVWGLCRAKHVWRFIIPVSDRIHAA